MASQMKNAEAPPTIKRSMINLKSQILNLKPNCFLPARGLCAPRRWSGNPFS